jgi:hypothetical protein
LPISGLYLKPGRRMAPARRSRQNSDGAAFGSWGILAQSIRI